MGKQLFRLLILSLITFVTASCSPSKKVFHFRGNALNEPYELHIAQSLSPKEEKAISSLIEETLSLNMSPFAKESIQTIQGVAPFTPVPLSPDLLNALETAKKISLTSKGRFLPLKMHFDPSFKMHPPFPKGWDALEWNETSLKTKRGGVCFDFSSIEKGHLLDTLGNKLKEKGLDHFCLFWGERALAKGRHPKGRFWSIKVAGKTASKEIRLKNEALSIKQDTKRFIVVKAKTSALADGLTESASTFKGDKALKVWADEVKQSTPQLAFWILSSDHSAN